MKKVNIIERILNKVESTDENECWNFQGGKNPDGYGMILQGRRATRVHKVVWEAYNAQPVPEGLQIRHKCDNRACCNPNHLDVGTHKQNMDDMKRRGRRADKLTESQIEMIMASNLSQSKMAEKLGVSQSAIYYHRKKKVK